MSKEFKPFDPQAIEMLAQTIGDYFTGSQITTLFQHSDYREITHDGTTKWRFVAGVFRDLQAKGGGQPHGILRVIQTAINPQGWLRKADEYERFLEAVNEILAFYGLRATTEGQLMRMGEKATTLRPSKTEHESAFDDRGFHSQVIRHARSHFCRGAYFHAVFESCKAFDTAVRDNSGISESGQPLMSKAFSRNGPVKINSQRTQSELDEQDGIMFLCMGLMNAIRNPQAHEPELNWPMNRDDALDVLSLVSFLFRKLDSAVVFDKSTGSANPVQLF